MQVPPTSTPAIPLSNKAGGGTHDDGQADTQFGAVLNKEISNAQIPDEYVQGKKSEVAREATPEGQRNGLRRLDEEESPAPSLQPSIVVPVGQEQRVSQPPGTLPECESPVPPQSPATSRKEEDEEPVLLATHDALTTISLPPLLPAPVESTLTPPVASAFEAGHKVVDSLHAKAELSAERTRFVFDARKDNDQTSDSKMMPDVLAGVSKPDSEETEHVRVDPLSVSAPTLEAMQAAGRSQAVAVEVLRDGESQPDSNTHTVASAIDATRSLSMSFDPPETVSTKGSDRLYPKVGTGAWETALGQKISWMIGDQQQTASLRLEPPDLGVLHVVVTVSQDQATAAFVAAEPEVRRALEAAIPRLREMMDTAGIQLGDATVSAGTSGNENASPGARYIPPNGRSDGHVRGPSVTEEKAQTSMLSRGLVDTFA
jgi:flagellar hook-length control protein FliK